MDKDALLKKATEILTPFETANIVDFMKHLTVKSAISNPWFVGIFLVIAFFAVVKRSKFVLSILFTFCSILLLLRYTMPAEGDSLALSTTIPFAFGGLAIGAVLIYLNFIKTE
ncbi:MAG TPA: hypothetical protein DCZ75_08950 [Geobacter sp.]|nr:hypothetical protein [Geobacter sp.]